VFFYNWADQTEDLITECEGQSNIYLGRKSKSKYFVFGFNPQSGRGAKKGKEKGTADNVRPFSDKIVIFIFILSRFPAQGFATFSLA
jgi:hypothetical protein